MSKVRALAINYRLAPQYPFPCALHDCLSSYLYLTNPPPGASHDPVPPSRIMIAGDSAGGNLALVTLCVLRDLGFEAPAAGILLSPWGDMTHSFPSVMENTGSDILPPYGFMHKPSMLWPPPGHSPFIPEGQQPESSTDESTDVDSDSDAGSESASSDSDAEENIDEKSSKVPHTNLRVRIEPPSGEPTPTPSLRNQARSPAVDDDEDSKTDRDAFDQSTFSPSTGPTTPNTSPPPSSRGASPLRLDESPLPPITSAIIPTDHLPPQLQSPEMKAFLEKPVPLSKDGHVSSPLDQEDPGSNPVPGSGLTSPQSESVPMAPPARQTSPIQPASATNVTRHTSATTLTPFLPPTFGPGITTRADGRIVVVLENGNELELLSQIQLHCANEQMCHPLVSPLVSPSLGGLPELFVMASDGEVLRDEIVYMAHRAANPGRYPIRRELLNANPKRAKEAEQYGPTSVHLQVYDDTCHMLPVLAFTEPAKHSYDAVAAFIQRVTARALPPSAYAKYIATFGEQPPPVSASDSSTTSNSPSSSSSDPSTSTSKSFVTPSPVPPSSPTPPLAEPCFIRERIATDGSIRPLEPPQELKAMQHGPDSIATLREAPVRRYLEGKAIWDERFGRQRKKIEKRRAKVEEKDARKGRKEERRLDWEDGKEKIPPSALAGRRDVKAARKLAKVCRARLALDDPETSEPDTTVEKEKLRDGETRPGDADALIDTRSRGQ